MSVLSARGPPVDHHSIGPVEAPRVMTSLRSNQLAVTCIKGTYEHKNSALLVKLAAQQFYPGKPTDVKELSAPKRSVVLFVDSERFNEEVIPRPFKRLRTGRPFKKHWTDGNEKLVSPPEIKGIK